MLSFASGCLSPIAAECSRRADLVREDELPVKEILDKRPDLLSVRAGIRRATDTWKET
jgi:hypothetical protein